MQVQLNDRQQHILWATVRHYIATAEPVGSKALLEEYNLGVSSATIRNAMGMLEKAGLLYQPHTSAGRIPSDSGYRIYVDRLMTPSDVWGRQVEQLLQEQLKWEDWSLEALLRGAAQILAKVSGCITLITMPSANMARLRHIQLIQIESGRIMLIVVTDTYETQSVLLDLPISEADTLLESDPEVIERELQILSNFLNSQLRGRSLCELASLDWNQLDCEFQQYGDRLKTVFADICRRTQPLPASTQIAIRGVSEVLRQPEFAELQQVQTILHLLEEEQQQLLPFIFEEPELDSNSRRRVTIRIGSENTLEPIRGCTLISSTYRRGTVPVGSVGVLGPTRLDYETAIAIVEAAADYLSDALSN
ncbi:heat-inducible transcriptional repressor HrcA [Scytonema millei]|uniref:Heat-inducible transcription repressor HrcA n=1 Tax=Scytonema millei VB511283 TaxID=1245923 RepID=A0A9X5E6T3_9CYAN|nr:heat-inducible transcriptional repressor HrcA [Scytonema millei]NHC36277.1 heat-inducible transcriptional repressor HrcA [Scytonema millei VB511283]